MEKLKQMKECLTGIVEGQIYGNLDKVDTKELGEAVDMIKDLAEAIYYCTITEAMEEGSEEESKKTHGMMYYTPHHMPHTYPIEYYDPRYREKTSMDTMYAQMNGNGSMSSANAGSRGGNVRNYREGMMPTEWRYEDMRDPHEGRSGKYRKMYMDGKGMKDKSYQMKELEEYIQELGADLAEMVQDASPEEKALLQSKISTLANKIK